MGFFSMILQDIYVNLYVYSKIVIASLVAIPGSQEYTLDGFGRATVPKGMLR